MSDRFPLVHSKGQLAPSVVIDEMRAALRSLGTLMTWRRCVFISFSEPAQDSSEGTPQELTGPGLLQVQLTLQCPGIQPVRWSSRFVTSCTALT